MLIGVPREIKPDEHRVALTPAGTEASTVAGHQVLIEADAGLGSGFTDDFYAAAGAVLDGGKMVCQIDGQALDRLAKE